MTVPTARLRGACLTLLLLVPAGLSAQMRASERGAVSQTIDGTVITIDYSRPQVRGRDSLFGGVEKWGAVWTPRQLRDDAEVNRPIAGRPRRRRAPPAGPQPGSGPWSSTGTGCTTCLSDSTADQLGTRSSRAPVRSTRSDLHSRTSGAMKARSSSAGAPPGDLPCDGAEARAHYAAPTRSPTWGPTPFAGPGSLTAFHRRRPRWSTRTAC
jgi:hypothetical protein